MLEDETVLCPICEKELHIKVNRFGRNTTYVVTENCQNCKTSAEKIEKLLNGSSSSRRWLPRVEKSYIMTDPRG